MNMFFKTFVAVVLFAVANLASATSASAKDETRLRIGDMF